MLGWSGSIPQIRRHCSCDVRDGSVTSGSDYDDIYRTPDWFGSDPSPLLPAFTDRLPPGSRVLDLGSGQGRHALPLARSGCRVTGMDLSAEAVTQVNTIATAEGLDCTVLREDIFAHQTDEPYDGVLCFGLFQMLPSTKVSPLADLLRDWVRPGGTVWITAWHTGDPRFEIPEAPWQTAGPRARHDPVNDRHLFYFHPEEILDFFPGWQVLHHHEGLGAVHRHGDGPPEQHGVVEAVLGRPIKPSVDVWTRLAGA